MKSGETTISVMGQRIPATYDERPIDELLFLPDNPRVHAATREMGDFDGLTPGEKQDRIYKLLLEEQSVKELLPEIRRDGGLQEPIVVRHDRGQVVEGNSRLAVYRKLEEESEDSRWDRIPCLVVGRLTDDQQIRLLGQAHLQGRTDWSRYSRAFFCYRKVLGKEKKTPKELSELTGMTVPAIKRDVEIVELMQANGDNKHSRFSYYEVLVKTRTISKKIQEDEGLKSLLLTRIKSGADFTAQEMRDWLPTVTKKPKIYRKFVDEKIGLEEAFDRAKVSRTQDRLKRIRDQLRDIESNEVRKLEDHEIKALQQVARQVGKEAIRVKDLVAAESGRRSQQSTGGS